MMKNALTQQTHGVRISHNENGLSPFTDSTAAGVNHGVILAAIGFIDRAVSDIETELGGELAKIISGGDAPLICAHSRHAFIHETELVLKGLALYADNSK
jgi:pantothenate kinase type III